MAEPETTSDVEKKEPQPKLGEAPDKETKEAVKVEVKKDEVASSDKEKTYTQADWDKREGETGKRISGLDTKLTETLKGSKENVSRLETALEAQQVLTEEARDSTFLKKVEADGGNVDAAKTLIAREKAARTLTRELDGRKKTLDAQETILAEAGKAKLVTDLIKEHELDPNTVDELLACETPEAVRIKALTLRIEKGAIDAKPVVKTDVPEGGQKTDISKMPLEERLGMGMEGKL